MIQLNGTPPRRLNRSLSQHRLPPTINEIDAACPPLTRAVISDYEIAVVGLRVEIAIRLAFIFPPLNRTSTLSPQLPAPGTYEYESR
jgi:hypothetical protein